MQRIASCGCAALKVVVGGEPLGVYACACLECQRATGSAFSYRARYRKGAVLAIEGEHRSWRRTGDEGRWVEQSFCPRCGTMVFLSGEALPGDILVSAGCFGDAAFPAPARLNWSTRRHLWYEVAGHIDLA
jgi:hypothetical protein